MPKTLRLESINDSPVAEYRLRGSVAEGYTVERRSLLPDGTEARRGSEWRVLSESEIGAILTGIASPVRDWLVRSIGGQLRNPDNTGRPRHDSPSAAALAKRRERERKKESE
jgi:hypothetical protein